MTEISRDDVLHLAQLSSLKLDDNEVDSLRTDIENILDHVELLGELDTSGVKPTYQVTDLKNVWREDEVVDSAVSRQQLIDLAPESKADQVKVPKVL